jgi:hypothetical protein
VSAKLIRKVGTTLTIALNAAVDKQLITSNPAARLKKPKVTKYEAQSMDPDQVTLFLTAAASDRLYAY